MEEFNKEKEEEEEKKTKNTHTHTKTNKQNNEKKRKETPKIFNINKIFLLNLIIYSKLFYSICFFGNKYFDKKPLRISKFISSKTHFKHLAVKTTKAKRIIIWKILQVKWQTVHVLLSIIFYSRKHINFFFFIWLNCIIYLFIYHNSRYTKRGVVDRVNLPSSAVPVQGPF
jgi:hypothetical protein